MDFYYLFTAVNWRLWSLPFILFLLHFWILDLSVKDDLQTENHLIPTFTKRYRNQQKSTKSNILTSSKHQKYQYLQGSVTKNEIVTSGLGEPPKWCLQDVQSWLSTLSLKAQRESNYHSFRPPRNTEILKKNDSKTNKNQTPENHENQQVRWPSKTSKSNFHQTL